MKFLVYGKGWIAQQIIRHLEKLGYDYCLGQSRVDDIVKVKKELVDLKITHVLCIIGRTHGIYNGKEYPTIDYLEQPGRLEENIKDNLFAPVSLAILCKELDISLNYLGTGCIFNYNETHTTEIGFTEEDQPNFFGSSYSIVKGFTDRLMHLLPVCNARIRMPITDENNSRNFITKIVNYQKICSMPNSMSVLDDLIPVFIDLAVRNFKGTINLTNPGVIEHNEILQMYKEIVDPNFVWQNFTYDEQIKILAAGRSNNYLDTKLLESLYPDVPHIKDSIRNVLIRMRENSLEK
jgi:nucleoside-diphosphate-sugar epimerase